MSEARETAPVWGRFGPLLEWYRREQRALPWRATRDPYSILVSEIMLQQTRVEAVIPFYERFLARFPNPASLARADLEEVHRYWAGLGYYRRADNLRRCAQELVRRRGFPERVEQLLELPGIGDYTAAAISSIAFGHPAVALDGNAIRVLMRIFGLDADPGSSATRRALKARTAPEIPADAAGDFTQALMELGARLCLPRQPRCLLCPMQTGCQARAQGLQEQIPRPKPRRPQLEMAFTALRIWSGPRVVLEKSESSRFLKGQWLFPWFEAERTEAMESYRERFSGAPARRLGEIKHTITTHNLTVSVWDLVASRPPAEHAGLRLHDPDDRSLPRLTRKILELRA